MIDDLLLHPRTIAQITQYVTNPSHATLLVAPHGMGKTCLAKAMLTKALQLSAPLTDHPYYLGIRPDGSSISIDAVRELQRFLQLKTVGHAQQLRRAVIIAHAEALTTEAQNALLKVLEEPPADTLIILTANSQRALLPTIRSRVQMLTVHTPIESDVKAYFGSKTDATRLTQAYFLSGGLPGLMSALINKEATHPLAAGVVQAKAILQHSLFERLALVEPLSKKKEEAGYVLEALTRIARTGLNGATAKADTTKLKQWHRILKQTHLAHNALAQNANPKLVLSNMMLNM
jgi:hypothetical protein